METVSVAQDASDSSPGLQAGLGQLRRGGGGTLKLQPGRYACRAPVLEKMGHKAEVAVFAEKLEDVTIDGGGAALTAVEGSLLIFRDCRRLTIRNLSIDAEPLPYTAGRVAEIHPDEHSFDIVPLVSARPTAGRPVRSIQAHDPERRRLSESGWVVYQMNGEREEPMLVTPEGLCRIFQRRDAPLPQKGWHVLARHRVYGHNALTFIACTDVTLENVTIRGAAGMGGYFKDTRDVTVRKVRVIPAEGGWLSTAADALHFNNCRGKVVVEDCEFEAMGDDALNVHGMYGLVTERSDDRTLVVAQARMNPSFGENRHASWDAPLAGDVLEYGTPSEPLIGRGELRVEAAREERQRGRTVVRFAEPLPSEVGAGTVLANATACPVLRVRGCRVRGNRARGMLLQTRDVVVEGCTFEDVSAAGIHVCADLRDWCESIGTRNVVIRNCVFRRCNYSVARRAAALDIFSDLPDGRQSAAGVHRDIQILDNVFEANSGAAIHVGSSEGVMIQGNRFIKSPSPLLRIMNSRNLTVRDNGAMDPRKDIAIEGATVEAFRLE